jgi:mRNA-degrading endonuclease RelE of RelBE toxin-antitoxin system
VKGSEFTINLLPRAEKFLHKADLNLEKAILKSLEEIRFNPYKHKLLVGDKSGIHSYKFYYSKSQFRILYYPPNNENIIYVLVIGPRGSVYDKA